MLHPDNQSSPKVTEESTLVSHLRQAMSRNLSSQNFKNAIFFSDKVLHLISSSTSQDEFYKAVYDLAYCYLADHQYSRCVELLERYELTDLNLKYRVLTGKALLGCNNMQACIKLLMPDPIQSDLAVILDRGQTIQHLQSQRHQLLAQCFEQAEDKPSVVAHLKRALIEDCQSYSAFEKLLSDYLLNLEEKHQLVEQMKFDVADLWLKDFYEARIALEVKPEQPMAGLVRVKVNDANQSHLPLASFHCDDLSRLTPPRFHADIMDEDMHQLRFRRETPGQGPPSQAEPSPVVNSGATNGGGAGVTGNNNGEALNMPLNRTIPQQVSNNTPSAGFSAQDLSRSNQPNGYRNEDVSMMKLLTVRRNFDVKWLDAQRHYNSQQYHSAFEAIKRIMDEDSYYTQGIPLYCAVLYELQKVGDLYSLAHKLVSSDPDSAISWFAVGCYYFLIKKHDLARKYFNKTIKLDRHFAAGWIAFGHSFAAQDESDAAMAAYRTAARLFPGLHQANLYIGMEYLRMSNYKTALAEFDHACRLNNLDPMVHNEIGVVHYNNRNYNEAKASFATAMSLCADGGLEDQTSKQSQSILLNLAHCHRKLRNYEDAIEAYEKCLSIDPKNASTYLALGYTHHLQFELNKALQYYHKAHFLRSDDSFVEELITRAMDDLMNQELFPIESTLLTTTNLNQGKMQIHA